jgi:hypothetical protein
MDQMDQGVTEPSPGLVHAIGVVVVAPAVGHGVAAMASAVLQQAAPETVEAFMRKVPGRVEETGLKPGVGKAMVRSLIR